MPLSKSSYIQLNADHDYVVKIKNSGYSQVASAVLFILLYHANFQSIDFDKIFLFLIILLCLLRIYQVNLYINKKSSIHQAVTYCNWTSISTGLLWGAFGIQVVLSHHLESVNILITFIVLIAFSFGTIISLGQRPLVLMLFNISILSPLMFYSYYIFKSTGDMNSFWLFGYVIVNLVYALKQSSDTREEIYNRFSTEFDLKQSVEELEMSKKCLEEETVKTFHASRLSSLGEMAGGVAHEINNPLTIVLGVTDRILSHEDDKIDESTRNKIVKVNLAGKRIAKIVKGMRIFSSKNDSIEHESIEISRILELAMSLYEERLNTVKIDFSLENPDDPRVFCNPLQVSQVFSNLISNALDAMETIESNRWLKIVVLSPPVDGKVEVLFINQGPLIPEAVAVKMFEPFYSTKVMGKGTGLGLSISRQLATNNNGVLLYEPYDGHVCFRMILKQVI